MAWSAAVTVTEPVSEPVSVAEAKEFVSIESDVDEFDSLLGGFIAAARSQVEAMTCTRLVEQTVELQADTWGDLLLLPIGPVEAVVSIVYDDMDGVEQVIDPGVYELAGAGFMRAIRTRVGQGWPHAVRRAGGAIRVRLSVGYDPLPPQIRTALLIMVSDQFAFRESGVVGTVAAEIRSSMQVDALLMNHRIWM